MPSGSAWEIVGWMKKSASGKVLNFGIGGVYYTVQISTVEKLISGDVKGAPIKQPPKKDK